MGGLRSRWSHRFQGGSSLGNRDCRFDALVVDRRESDQNLLACHRLTGFGFGFSQKAQRKRIARILLKLRDGYGIATIEKRTAPLAE